MNLLSTQLTPIHRNMNIYQMRHAILAKHVGERSSNPNHLQSRSRTKTNPI